MVVVGEHADAMACRDLGSFPFLEEGFDNHLVLRLRQVLQLTAKDLMELVEVVLRASFGGRGRIVLAMIIPGEDGEEPTFLQRSIPTASIPISCGSLSDVSCMSPNQELPTHQSSTGGKYSATSSS
jgi:hypothetical protein